MKTLYLYNKKTSFLLLLVMLLLLAPFVSAQTITSTAAGGTWNLPGTWIGGVVPATGNNVIIATAAGSKVTVSASTSIVDVTINPDATLEIRTRTLTVNGSFTNNGSFLETSGHLNLPTGNFTNSGTFSVTGAGQLSVRVGSFNSTSSYTQSGGTIRFGGHFTYTGTFSLGSAAIQILGAANQSIKGFSTTGSVNMIKTEGVATLISNVTAGGLIINGGSTAILDLGLLNTHTFNGNWTRTSGILNCSSSIFRIGLSFSGSGGTFNPDLGTVQYYREGNQTIAPVTYNNLTLSGSGVKTITTATTVVNKVFSMEGTATASSAPTYASTATLKYNIAVARTIGAEWITPFVATGGVVISGVQNTTINGPKVFNSEVPLTINSGAKLRTGANSLTLGGDFINSGGTFTSTGPIVVANTMASQTIAGFTTTGLVSMTKTAGTATFGGNVAGAGLTIDGAGGTLNLGASRTHTFTGAVTLTSGTLNGGSSILNVNFTGTAWVGAGTNFASEAGTVNFGGGAQVLNAASTVFNNLTFSNSKTKTLTSIPTVNGVLSMEGTAAVSVAPIYGTTAALQYNRATALSSGPEWITPFVATGGVSTIGVGVITVATSNKVFNSSVPLTIGSGATLGNGGFAISGSSELTVSNGGSLLLSGTSSFPVFTTTSLATTSTVNYNGTAQTVAVQDYGDLLLSVSGNKTFVGATTVAGDFRISGTAVALLPNGTTSSAQTLTLAGVLQSGLGSYGGTASSATNKSTWFGPTTTGIFNIITACEAGTWLGITNSDWNVSTNWCGGTIPTDLTDVVIGFTSNQPIVGASGGICRNLTILSGATLSVSSSNMLTLSGDWTNEGTFTSNASTVNFSGTAPQSIGGSSTTVFYNLSNLNSAAPISATNGFTVNNTLNIANSTSVLDMGVYTLTDGGAFSNTGGGQLKTLNTTSTPIPVAITWYSTVLYANSTGGQTIVAGTYDGEPSLEIGNTTGTQIASGNIVTGGQLNINNDGTPVFNMNGFNLTTNALNILAVNSILDMQGGTLSYSSLLAMDGKVRFSGATNAIPFPSGTVEYYGANQTVTSGNYFKLLFTGASGVYTMASDIRVASTLNVTNGDVTLQAGYTLSVDDAVTVISPGTLTLESSASLLQTTYTGPNVGDVIVKRNTTPIVKFDDTFWSSPTTGTQTLLDFSPLTESSRFFSYDSVNDLWVQEDPATKVFEKGRGYTIRAPFNTSFVPTINTSYKFIGVPNNGTFTIPLTTPSGDIGLSLVGNPYPSALNAEDFITENLHDLSNPTNTLTGTYYFWSHNSRTVDNNNSGDDYYTVNLSGPTGFTNMGTGNNTLPTGYIASGQGFFVENEIVGDLKFNNSMRESKNNTNFYRTKTKNKVAELERNRLWFNITNSSLTKGSQTMVGYIENATNDFDLGYDSYVFDPISPSLLIYSMLGSDLLVIQGRALPFSNADYVRIGYSTKTNDTFTITLDQMDGLFNDSQDVYLEDKLLNVIADIKSDPYTFASSIGTFNDRFVLRFTNPALGNKEFNSNEKTVIVSLKNKQIKINSYETIDRVEIYDLLGRQVYLNGKVNSNALLIENIVSGQQTLIVKTVLQNGTIVTDKIVY